ncbi:MAG: hypothetical protein ACRDAU_18875 [Clostridium sp.]
MKKKLILTTLLISAITMGGGLSQGITSYADNLNQTTKSNIQSSSMNYSISNHINELEKKVNKSGTKIIAQKNSIS